MCACLIVAYIGLAFVSHALALPMTCPYYISEEGDTKQDESLLVQGLFLKKKNYVKSSPFPDTSGPLRMDQLPTEH